MSAGVVDAYGRRYRGGSGQEKKAGFRRRVVASFRDERFDGMLRDGLSMWRSLSGGHPLFLIQQDYLLALSYWLYFTNNIIGGIIEKSTDVVCGKGFDYQCKSPELKQRLDRFWRNDRINNFAWLEDVYTSWLSVFGECCFTLFTRPDGSVRVGFVEPYNIDRTYTDAGNPFVVTGVRLKSTGTERQPVLTTVIDPTQPDEALFDSDTRAQRETFVMEDGEKGWCVYFFLNPRFVPADDDTLSLRGTPPLLSSFDPAADAEEVLFSMRRRADMASRILWDVSIEGAGQDDIDEFLEETDVPDEYTVNAHNEKVSWNMISPDLKASEHETQHRVLRNYALSRQGQPPTWHSDPDNANYASAKELPFISLLSLEKRQKKQGIIFYALWEYQAVQAKHNPDEIETIFPTLSKKDMKEMAATMRELSAALSVAEDRAWLTKDEARETFRANVEDLGTELGEYAAPEGDPRVTKDYSNYDYGRDGHDGRDGGEG